MILITQVCNLSKFIQASPFIRFELVLTTELLAYWMIAKLHGFGLAPTLSMINCLEMHKAKAMHHWQTETTERSDVALLCSCLYFRW